MKIHISDQRNGGTNHCLDVTPLTTFGQLKALVVEKVGNSDWFLFLGNNLVSDTEETSLKDMGLVSGDKLFLRSQGEQNTGKETKLADELEKEQLAQAKEREESSRPARPPTEPLPTSSAQERHREQEPVNARGPVRDVPVPLDGNEMPQSQPQAVQPQRPAPSRAHPDTEFYTGIDDPLDPLRDRRMGYPDPQYPIPAGPSPPVGPFGQGPLAPLGHPGGPLGPPVTRPNPLDPFGGGEVMSNRPRRPPGEPRIFPFNPTDRGSGGFGGGGGFF